MDRRDFLKLGAVTAIGLSSSCAYQFVKSKESLREDIKTVLENVVPLDTHIIYDGGESSIFGHGLIMGDYIITNDHIVTMHGIEYRTPFGTQLIIVDKQSEETMLKGSVLENIAKDRETDMAIFKLPDSYQKPKPARFGDDDKLELLDKLYLVGDPFDRDYVVRPGYLGKKDIINIPTDFGMVKGKVFTGQVSPGDSGSPLLNDKGEVIGLVSYKVQSYSTFVPINRFKEKVEWEK